MRHLRNATAALLCSVMISMAPMPPAAAASEFAGAMLPDDDYPRPAMPHVDETRLIDDGSLYREIIASANASGTAAKSSDYVYGAAESKDHVNVWVPVRRNEGASPDLTYEDARSLCLECTIDTRAAKGDDPSFSPVTLQLLDEDGTVINQCPPPMTTAEVRTDGETPGTAFRSMRGTVIESPAKRYTLRLTEQRPTGDTTEDVTFSVDEKGEILVLDKAGKAETPAASRGESEPWRLLEEREYENGVTLRADACTRTIEASHRHSEILYDPSQHDEEFSKALEIGCPDGCTAADAERIWQDLARRRATAAAYPPVPDLETDASATPDGQEGQGGAATGYVVALAAIATVGMLIVAATFVRRKK